MTKWNGDQNVNVQWKLDKDSAFYYLREGRVGAYLLRKSSDSSAACTLTIRTQASVLHVRIYRTVTGKLYIDSPENSRITFDTMKELLEFYCDEKRNMIALNADGSRGESFSIKSEFGIGDLVKNSAPTTCYQIRQNDVPFCVNSVIRDGTLPVFENL